MDGDDRGIEFTQTEKKENKLKTKQNSRTCGRITKELTFISLCSKTERRGNGTEQVPEDITAETFQVWQKTDTQIQEVKQILEIGSIHRALH